MVINPSANPEAASLLSNQTSARSSQRAASAADNGVQTPSADTSTSLISTTQSATTPGPEIQDANSADDVLGLLMVNIHSQPGLVMRAQANQIPASVLQLLQP